MAINCQLCLIISHLIEYITHNTVSGTYRNPSVINNHTIEISLYYCCISFIFHHFPLCVCVCVSPGWDHTGWPETRSTSQAADHCSAVHHVQRAPKELPAHLSRDQHCVVRWQVVTEADHLYWRADAQRLYQTSHLPGETRSSRHVSSAVQWKINNTKVSGFLPKTLLRWSVKVKS